MYYDPTSPRYEPGSVVGGKEGGGGSRDFFFLTTREEMWFRRNCFLTIGARRQHSPRTCYRRHWKDKKIDKTIIVQYNVNDCFSSFFFFNRTRTSSKFSANTANELPPYSYGRRTKNRSGLTPADGRYSCRGIIGFTVVVLCTCCRRKHDGNNKRRLR